MLYVFDKILTYELRVSPTHESVEFVKVFLRGALGPKNEEIYYFTGIMAGKYPQQMTLKLPEFSVGPKSANGR